MQVTAILDPLSATAREWRSRLLTRGLYFGVVFVRRGMDYVAADLNAADHARLEGVGFVKFEIQSAPPAVDPAAISDEELFGAVLTKKKPK